MSIIIENTRSAPVTLWFPDAQQPQGLGRRTFVAGEIKVEKIRDANTITAAQWAEIQKKNSNRIFFVGKDPVLVPHGAKCKWLDDAKKTTPKGGDA